MLHYKSMILSIILAVIIIFLGIQVSLENFNQDVGFDEPVQPITAVYYQFLLEQYQHLYTWKQDTIIQIGQWWQQIPNSETMQKMRCHANDLIRTIEEE